MTTCLFDAHLHIIDPRFPLVANQGYLPPPFTAEDYRAASRSLGIGGGAVVSGSFQAFDQSYLTDALERLGPDFVGVTQLPAGVSNQELDRLNAAGVRALRFNLKRGGSAGLEDLEQLAQRAYRRVGWHVELYIDSGDLAAIEARLKALPQIVVDHLGLSGTDQPCLLRLVEAGAKVKATGFGRLDFSPGPFLRQIADIDPGALLFGSDLPSTRAPRPFEAADIALIEEVLSEAEAEAALYGNAVALYRPKGQRALSRS
ncbi:MAG: amidohydrolase family protein [Kiloniellales bacterium]